MQNYSVLMSVYYKENPIYLEAAIESIMNQTVKTDDFVLVCDGPLTTELDRVIDEYVHKYPVLFNIIRLEENIGLAKALNAGIVKCKNELVARMDSDDIAAGDRMEKQLKIFADKDVQIVSGTVTEFSGNQTTLDAVFEDDALGSERVLPEHEDDILSFAKKRSPFNHPAVMYKKSVVEGVGLYQDYRFFEDYSLWATMLNAGYKGYNIKDTLVYMRAGASMYKRRGGISYIGCIYRFEKHLYDIGFISGVNFIKSVFIRTVVSIIPNGLRTTFYSKILRK
ncbi:MAG: glycosyltransferase [Lachnospiraceae bacterium]|nr:glycosyltransferase [Lachnospiraceae bacterium]